ncbi:glucosyl transferase [Chimaeribacter arupi]|uniref:glucosyl transferase n=2 Tax=Chimaeribacter arupi TaxID=2060066 RepID=UPI0011AF3619|nr:glucosyl transferase [Chimaeribacter arupi]
MELKRNWIQGLIILIATYFILFLRRPDILTNAQFWAEDGVIWYKNAYEYGALLSLLHPQNGYYQTISKIAAGFSTLIPLDYAPFFTNAIGLLIRSLLVWFFLSKRFAFAPLLPRIIISIYAVVIPYSDEVHSNITNAHWFLGLYSLIILTADNTKNKLWLFHDIIILTISSLSGPFSVFLLPCIAVKYFYNTQVNTIFSIKNILSFIKKPQHLILIAGAFIQIIAIVTSSSVTRSQAPLGASPLLLSNIISSRLLLSTFSLMDMNDMVWSTPLISYSLTMLFFFITAVILYSKNWRLISLLILGLLVVGFSLARPMISLTEPQWPPLKHSGYGQRYFIIINIAIFSVIAFSLYSKCSARFSKIFYTCTFITTLAFIIYKSFIIAPLPDHGWKSSVATFNAAAPGEQVTLPIPPGWDMTLIKK